MIAVAAAILCVWALLALALDRYGLRPLPAGPYDAIVVAGCRVNPGGVPSKALQLRTERAVELWQQGLAPVVVFTGGVGAVPPAEAVAAADYALTLGLDRAAIRIEDRSTSTEENARFAVALVGGDRVLVVTHAYHVFRAERVFRRYFSQARGVGVPGLGWPRARGALREVGAVAGYGLRGSLSEPPTAR